MKKWSLYLGMTLSLIKNYKFDNFLKKYFKRLSKGIVSTQGLPVNYKVRIIISWTKPMVFYNKRLLISFRQFLISVFKFNKEVEFIKLVVCLSVS